MGFEIIEQLITQLIKILQIQIYFHFAKVFDSVSQNILICKLKNYDIHDILLKLIIKVLF